MARINCKGCDYKPSEHDTLGGYCLICAEKIVVSYDLLQAQVHRLSEALRNCHVSETHIKEIKQNESLDDV